MCQLFFAVFRAVEDFLAGDRFAVVVLLAADVRAVEDFLAGERFVAVDFAAGDFFASVFAADFFAVVEEDFLASVLAATFFAVDFDAVDLLVADVRLAAVDFDAVPLRAAVFLAVVVFLAGDEDAVDLRADDVVAAPVVAATLGSFLAPETTAFRSAPARNFGTAVFFARVRSPVRGLRTMREGRMAFSKAPKPVIATFSPLDTSRVMVSRTDSRAC